VKKEYDFLIYDKVYWERDRYEKELIEPIRRELRQQSLRFTEIRYGHYKEEDFHSLLKRSNAMIFLSMNETQGIAYQQALSMDVPILAWDRGGFWQDPSYYPDKVKFGPVSSVPYWNDRCGLKFTETESFQNRLEKFLQMQKEGALRPRQYILDNLTLKKTSEQYLEHIKNIAKP
jgi:glycosyltransferase involved in cell wall biosynthesis